MHTNTKKADQEEVKDKVDVEAENKNEDNVAEAKEEMKWVKTRIEIKEDRIIIKRPYIYHKYKDFRYFKVDQEDDYYLFYIGFSNEELIHFRTKEKCLVDIIMDKIEQTSLQYEYV